MNANIRTDELRLLAYLHEHATGYGSTHAMKARAVFQSLGIEESQFRKDASFLEQFGLVGLGFPPMVTLESNGKQSLIYLTGDGENLMREVEAQVEVKEPGRFKRIGLKAVEVAGDLVKAVAIKVLTDKLSGHK